MLRYFIVWLMLVLTTTPTLSDSMTIGPFGVNRVVTGLTGAGPPAEWGKLGFDECSPSGRIVRKRPTDFGLPGRFSFQG